ncbi:MAG: hypothetical protein JW727_06365 [Candidatus Aenigmarchaeota archaeon]|nr:hypothetical protein [Candidatus Aenigmarchaeota archaeon]
MDSPETRPTAIKDSVTDAGISRNELKRLYSEFRSFGEGEQAMPIGDPKGLMGRFKYREGDFKMFMRAFNKAAMEFNIPIFIKLDRNTHRSFLCYENKGGVLFSVF